MKSTWKSMQNNVSNNSKTLKILVVELLVVTFYSEIRNPCKSLKFSFFTSKKRASQVYHRDHYVKYHDRDMSSLRPLCKVSWSRYVFIMTMIVPSWSRKFQRPNLLFYLLFLLTFSKSTTYLYSSHFFFTLAHVSLEITSILPKMLINIT